MDVNDIIKNNKDIINYMIDDGINYQLCQHQFQIIKSNKMTTKKRHAYVLNQFLLICKTPFQKIPKKIIELRPNNRIIWDYNKQKIQYQLEGFRLLDGQNIYEYISDEQSLVQLKKLVSQRIFQSKFQDEYKVECQIGKGNYARVYSAIHRGTNIKYAVKCFEKQKLLEIDKGMLSIYNELKVMRDLKSNPNIIKLYEVFEGENTFYFVMEKAEGICLYDEIKNHSTSPYKDQEIKEIIKCLIEGIAYCSSQNIMHRDIKPENILIHRNNNKTIIKIVDFGLASYVNEFPYIFPKCGTPGFVAPEIANLVDKTLGYSQICDMFSIGVIFHILLTGEAVFPGKKFNDVLKKNKECVLDFNKKLYDNISTDCKNLLSSLLEKDPLKRINCKQALQHPYIYQQYIKKLSIDDIYGINQQQIPAIRQKNNSLFTSPLRIPYLTKEDTQGMIQDCANSFVTKELINGNKGNCVNMHYTVGSMDQQLASNSMQQSTHKNQLKLIQKESIQEECVEQDDFSEQINLKMIRMQQSQGEKIFLNS